MKYCLIMLIKSIFNYDFLQVEKIKTPKVRRKCVNYFESFLLRRSYLFVN